MASLVGLNPDKDINWAIDPSTNPKNLFIENKIDAFFCSAPRTQELRARKIGHSIVNMATDRPWSQYFCCMLAGNAEFVRKYPVATKRLLRAILKAVDICAVEPEQVARLAADRGAAPSYDYTVQALRELPYRVWRDYDAEDTMRFYALRLNEIGFIKSTPQKLIAEHTDWRFLNELKRELKT
jgi:NitT/TauT family transport system substrate-binding protein